MLEYNSEAYEMMFGAVGEDASGMHLCSCACNCSCHCRCGIYEEDSYEETIW